MSFAPSGITDDHEIRTAASLVDYIFRRLALTYLSFDDRLELGLASIDDMPAAQTTLIEEPKLKVAESKIEPTAVMETKLEQPKHRPEPSTNKADTITDSSHKTATNNAPLCYNCGDQTQRAGSCYVCSSCGTTTGCS
jgi:ribonucleoside-diphosphate reductase alpha chain